MSRYWKENRWNKTESSETTLIALMAKWSYNLIFRSAIWNDEKKKYLFGISCLEVLGLGGNYMNIHNFR